MTSTQTRSAITLKGSAQLVADYLNFGIHSILYQRGVYPPEDFKQEEHFGLTILVSTDQEINTFIQSVLGKMKEWLLLRKIKKISLIILNSVTKENLERWDFNLQYEGDANIENGDVTGKKEIKVIQSEIRDVLRQICSTVSFLPLLDCQCSFDLMVYTTPDCDVPDGWEQNGPCFIANAQELQLRSFSTSFHKMDTIVSYKAE